MIVTIPSAAPAKLASQNDKYSEATKAPAHRAMCGPSRADRFVERDATFYTRSSGRFLVSYWTVLICSGFCFALRTSALHGPEVNA